MPRSSLILLLLGLALSAHAAHAQIGLPGLPPLPAGLDRPVRPLLDDADARLRDLTELRTLQIRGLLRQHRDRIDTDFQGEPVVRGELLLLTPDPDRVSRFEQAGFRVKRRLDLGALDLDALVLQPPSRLDTRQAMRRARRIDPDAVIAFNHLYLGSGATAAGASTEASAASIAIEGPAPTLGLIDSGIDTAHPALAGVAIERWGCEGDAHAAAHGTAVASLLAGDAAGPVAPGTRLLAADIYCGQPEGGAVTGLAQAMAWLSGRGARVINVSLVGADNALLAKTIAAMQARGHLIVAAVGNDGPAAAPLFPAAYPGVVGVTAVDARQRLIPEALRGEQVAFAAPGAGLQAAAPRPREWQAVRGTSFAAPLVARIAAREWRPGEPAADLLSRLRAQAVDLGSPGRDRRFGDGLLEAGLRLKPVARK